MEEPEHCTVRGNHAPTRGALYQAFLETPGDRHALPAIYHVLDVTGARVSPWNRYLYDKEQPNPCCCLHAGGMRHRTCWMANVASSCYACQGCLWRDMPQAPCLWRTSLAEGASIPCLQHGRYHICHRQELTHHRRCTIPAGCQRLPVGRYRLRPGVLGRGGADATPGGTSRALGPGVVLTCATVAWVRCGCELCGAQPGSVSHADLCVA